jgi:hypothetical protein
MNKQDQDAIRDFAMKLKMARVRSHWTAESREKARLALIGQKRSPGSKEKMRRAALGRKHSAETIAKIKEARQKQIITPKMLESLKLGRGEKSILWKGDNVGYRALHRWTENHLGKPTECEHCHKDNLSGHSIHWANKSGEYKREISDWIRLCALCHKKYDKEKIIS